MKKAVILTLESDKEKALDELRDAGVVHLEKKVGGVNSQDLSLIQTALNQLDAAIRILPEDIEPRTQATDREEAEKLVMEILSMEKEEKELEDRLSHIVHDLDILEHWDNIDPDDLSVLKEKDLKIALYLIPEKEFKGLPEGNVHIVKKQAGFVSLLAWAYKEEPLPDWEAVELPEHGPDRLNSEKNEIIQRQKQIREGFTEAAKKLLLLQWYKGQLEQELEWEEARLLFDKDETIVYISGFVPVDESEKLKERAVKRHWGLVLSDPSEEDAVPTKLKVGKIASLLMPVMEFLGIMPGYRELDISFFFLIFFTVFTAMLIGDAGYGMIFLAVALTGMGVSAAKGVKIHKALVLLTLLSIATIAWGMLTGTWFASKTLMEIPLLQQLKIPFFTGSDEELITVIMSVSFFLGVVQLSLGIVQGFIFEFPQLKSLARIGWLAVMIAVYALILTLVIDREGIDAYPKEMMWLMLAGVAFIFLFGSQEKGQSFLKGVATAFANFLQNFLDVVGTFSNLMSYVRLFAVGLASVKIAETFNVLAADMADGWKIIFAVLIIVLGHTLNIILGLMAILVHAVRLNILEYSGQIGIEWSGFKYEPFRVQES